MRAKVKGAPVVRTHSKALTLSGDLAALVERVVAIIETAQTNVARAVNSSAVLAAWHVGREIVEYVQKGSARAEYGEQVISDLSQQIQPRVGRGYSARNLRYFRSFYLTFPDRSPTIDDAEFGTGRVPNLLGPPERAAFAIRHTSSAKSAGPGAKPRSGFSSRLSWSHYRALLQVDDASVRTFYEVEAANAHWTVENLERQIFTQLHLRLRKSRNKEGVMDLARRGQVVERPIDALKDPVVMDLFDLPHSELLRESDLETAIISKLSQFLLELGKGFAFVARQKRITFEDEDFFVDLVFYNVILKCYLLVDLKLGKLTHQDVGQMDSYVRLFDAQGRTPGDGPTIGLILCAEKNEAIARYSILHEHEQLFAAKYVTYLPSEEELQRELERDRRIAEALVDPTRSDNPPKMKRATRAKGRKH
jgi:predicted nuclease of restriction endonuclease-like (RecB) superfamily